MRKRCPLLCKVADNAATAAAVSAMTLGFFRRAVAWRPHRAKVETGGEDAFLATDFVLGVADGVGYWTDKGVNPGAYSEGLMRTAFDFFITEYQGQNCVPPMDILRAAYRENVDVPGTSTALLASLCNDQMDVVSLGDCTILVLRNGELVFRNEEQHHSLNFPYQLGTGSNDKPDHAQQAKVRVQPGDLVVLGSDGIFDNLYDRDIIKTLMKTVTYSQRRATVGTYFNADGRKKEEQVTFLDAVPQSLLAAANQILEAAAVNSVDPRVATPFSDKCVEAGAYAEGGKQDDMTLIVSCIGPDVNESSGERFAHRDDDKEIGRAHV